MIKNIHILLLVPVWYWPFLFFMPKFFEEFPYENRNIERKWEVEVFLESLFVSRRKAEFTYNGKFYKAYIKTRIEALKVSIKFPGDEFSVLYYVGEKNVSIN